jgi:hypothetical protein
MTALKYNRCVYLFIYNDVTRSCRKYRGMDRRDRRRGRRRKQLVDDLEEKKGYWKLRVEALDRPLWRTRLGRSYGTDVREMAE